MRGFLASIILGVRAQRRSGHLARFALKLDPSNLKALWTLYLKKNKEQTVMRRLPTLLQMGAEDPDLALLIERYFHFCHAQYLQDLQFLRLFPQYEHERGFFVEIGVGEGQRLSNTYLFEKALHWDGVLVEANPNCWASIEQKRDARLIRKAAWNADGEALEFLCTETPEYSGLRETAGKLTKNNFEKVVIVETIRTETLLLEVEAPDHIPFFSLDTEGSELEILQGIDFERRSFDLICVEHGWDQSRKEKLISFLSGKGYLPIFPERSAIDFWFVREALAQDLLIARFEREIEAECH